jgi:hypothetical protein
VGCARDDLEDFLQRVVDVDDVHLGAGHHEITHGEVANLQDTLHHGDCVCVDDRVCLCFAKLLEEFFFFVGSPEDSIEQALEGMTQA